MQEFINEQNNIEIAGQTDVIVIGGGVAGVAAALAAARNGMKVLILEKAGMLGGLATMGHVCIYLAICDGRGRKIMGGMAEELLHLSIKYGYNNLPQEWYYGADRVENPSARYRTHFNIPAFVFALDELMEKEGIDVLYDTVFSSPIMEGQTCRGVIVENKSGRTAYLAKMIVDASGDADVMFRAGAPCVEQDSIVSHWCYEADLSKMAEVIASGDALKVLNLKWIGLRPDADNSQSKLKKFRGTDVRGVTDYLKYSRSLALDYLKENQRKDYAMFTLPAMPQFRTTRRIVGQNELKMSNGNKHIQDSIGCMVDNLAVKPIYEVPYGSLIDPNLKNIIAAGRIVAAEGAEGWELIRGIPNCVLTGEAAGTAAALAIKNEITLQDINIEQLQEMLSKAGIMIHCDDEDTARYEEIYVQNLKTSDSSAH